ncbi:expressed unknown protein [Seminavis robusta]|uniref:Uncharacterized protein n=1 Tax=Seminavis robusta TaxID=568900 RepID=A0A9N8ER57_9STRA|nr:expressed unknown protein [Seminavis robusta]|eukprot:Sro1605_g285430.1 n/a (209) ;mRNA; f:14164-14960
MLVTKAWTLALSLLVVALATTTAHEVSHQNETSEHGSVTRLRSAASPEVEGVLKHYPFSSTALDTNLMDSLQDKVHEALAGTGLPNSVAPGELDIAKTTPNFGAKCNSLLKLFHRNEEKGEYTIHKSATWRDVCRAEGSTRYLKVSEVESKLGKAVADHVFEDLVMCTSNIDRDYLTFFTADSAARVPTAVNPDALDKHGKLMNVQKP